MICADQEELPCMSKPLEIASEKYVYYEINKWVNK